MNDGAMSEAPEPSERAEDAARRVRGLFVGASAVALVALLLVLVAHGSSSAGSSSRALRLMPSIGAELIGTELSATQAGWTLEGPDGATTLAAALPRDTLVFLNFWATWCAPCREELPSMFRLRQELADRRFMMVAVSYDESWDDIRQAFQRWFQRTPTRQQLEVLRDPILDDGKTLRDTFGTTKIPDTYVILNGRILARFVNARDWTDPNIVSYFRTLAPAL